MRAVYVARWSVAHAGRIVITGPEDSHEVDAIVIPPGGDRPGPGLFCGSVWSPYPGPEWEEDHPGQWSRPVYREDR
jgi:hypothetical protein